MRPKVGGCKKRSAMLFSPHICSGEDTCNLKIWLLLNLVEELNFMSSQRSIHDVCTDGGVWLSLNLHCRATASLLYVKILVFLPSLVLQVWFFKMFGFRGSKVVSFLCIYPNPQEDLTL
ncbi:hypothetical protein Bca52824_017888 [Brassica carinata]|uniref:Uncharacterized protein n=1 Tax=Brassica carinata TaxID=52824 RepID=A0A8X7VNX9_BRACI|nr:hypothetical protein Bca52824_017888 [Brassica carinata]